MRRVEIFVAFLGPKVDKTSAGIALVEQYNSKKEKFELIEQGAQTAAAVATVVSITAVTPGFIPFVGVAANTLAGTMTLMKISADLIDGKKISRGDRLALAGNVLGIVGSIMFLGSITAGAPVIAGLAVVTSILSIMNSDTAGKIYEEIVDPLFSKYFRDKPNAVYPDHWVSPDLSLLPYPKILSDHNGNIARIEWDSGSNSLTLGRMAAQDSLISDIDSPLTQSADVGGGGGGGSVDGWIRPGHPVMPPNLSSGGAQGTAPPILVEVEPMPEKDLGIKVEITRDPPYENAPPAPLPPRAKEPQDSYGCCSGSQDSYG